MTRRLRTGLAALLLALVAALPARAEEPSLEQRLLDAMHAYSVPAVSYAVIEGGEIVELRALSLPGRPPVTPDSVFQAASIGKAVAAYGMTNSENGGELIDFLVPLVAQQRGWPCWFPFLDELVAIPARAC